MVAEKAEYGRGLNFPGIHALKRIPGCRHSHEDHHGVPGISLLYGPREDLFLMSEVPL